MRKLCGQGTAGVQTLTNGKLYKVTLGTKVWTGYPIKYTWTAHEYAYFLETDIGLTLEDEHDDNPSWAGWKAYITTGSTVDWYAHLTIEENSGENVTKLDNKYLDMDSAPASGSAKPVTSGGVYTALTGKISTTAKGAANGVASLDETGKIPSTQMPDTQLNSTQAADAYDPTATYAVGDKVSYAGNVYSCISAISTPEAWDSTHWDQVDPIQDQVDDVRNTLTQLDQNMAYVESGNTASRTYAAADFISWKGTLYKANQAIPATTAFSTGSGGNLDLVAGNGGGLNNLIDSASNYCKMPDGTLIQWGNATFDSADGPFYAIAFPMTFSSSSKHVYLTEQSAGVVFRVPAISNTGCTAMVLSGTFTGTQDVAWLAIGRWK
jgi:hypothetical protein